MTAQRCPHCQGTVAGVKAGQEALSRALAAHEASCPGLNKVRRG